MTRYIFDSEDYAVEALLIVLEDARETDKDYSFGSLSAAQVFASGLILVGDIEDIKAKLDVLEGAERYDF